MMHGDEVENAIRKNVVWNKLPEELRIMLGGSQREYDKRVLDYSIRNQLRYKDNIVRHVKRSQEEYYENLLSYSQSRLILYPYHLSDILVRELRITPFTYYTNMIVDVMQAEKSYDSIPNFTAVDVMRILGIGRNQYIDLMNQNRANRRLFRRSKSIREILPQKPTILTQVEPWFLLCYGCILENDIRLLSSVEKELVDRLLDEGPVPCGLLDRTVMHRLVGRGLVYLDVPVQSDDYIYVPTLDGFVMNRVQGDYFETLLYKIFVAIDGQTSVQELAETIDIEMDLVKNAVSVFCRLGFARKRVTGIENMQLHRSWDEYLGEQNSGAASPAADHTPEPSVSAGLSDLSMSLKVTAGVDFDDEDDIVAAVENALKVDDQQSPPHGAQVSPVPQQPTPGFESANKRVAFIFDSTLTAFLMMGNLSATLKNHAVTLFEVGKLSDEALDSFIDELQNVNLFAEGEAQRYSEHAKTLLYTIQSLRGANEIDLIRGESLQNLESVARLKVIKKAYKMLVSMAPINAEACCLPLSSLPHLGTASIELTLAWFRLFLYELIGDGPPALLLPMGSRLARLPKMFWESRRLMVTQGTHEPLILPIESALVPIAESLLCAPVFLQAYSELVSDTEIVNVPFPFEDDETKTANCVVNGTETTIPFYHHPSVKKLRSLLQLDQLCGYIVLLKLFSRENEDETGSANSKMDEEESEAVDNSSSSNRLLEVSHLSSFNSSHSLNTFQFCNSSMSKDPKKVASNRSHLAKGESMEDYVLFDCVFGIPLFDEAINKTICQRIIQKELLAPENYQNMCFAMQNVIDSTREFITRFQGETFKPEEVDSHLCTNPMRPVMFDPKKVPDSKCTSQFRA